MASDCATGEDPMAGYDPHTLLCSYFSDKTVLSKRDAFQFPLESLQHVFKRAGGFEGKVLTSIEFSPALHHLLSACEFYDEIYIGTLTELDVAEWQKWIRNEPGCFNWTAVEREVCASEADLDAWKDKEKKLRKSIKRCLRFDFRNRNPFDPVELPAADCLIIFGLFETCSKDKEDFLDKMKKCVALIKDGGHMVVLAYLELTYFVVEQHKFSCFSYNEQFLRESLDSVGCHIQELKTILRDDRISTTITDYKHFAFVVASKKCTA